MERKLKMSNFKFRLIIIPIAVFFTALFIVVNIAGNLYESVLDDRIGRGARTSVLAEGTENWDTDYYDDKYDTVEESKAAEYKIALDVQREGSILLKNNGVLPLAKNSTVTPFGARFRRPVYGQTSSSGSAKWTVNPTTPRQGLTGYFTINDAIMDALPGVDAQERFPSPPRVGQAADTVTAGSGDWFSHSSGLYEYPTTTIAGAAAAASGTALVFIGREGSEGSDKKYDAYTDGTKHYFALSKNEKDTIALAKTSCDKLVVILQAASAMEIPELMTAGSPHEADAILLIGHAGERGYDVLGELLTGETNPSGRTVAVWASDFYKDPTYRNFGQYQWTNTLRPTSAQTIQYYIEYAEDMYMGYRYYETAHDIQATGFTYGTLNSAGGIATPGAVLYPFGYGMSYTTFKQEIQSYSDAGDSIAMTVRVTNEGSRAGKEVVQLYYNPPYGQIDRDMKIEKPTKTMIAFDKTKMLAPKAYEDIEFKFLKEDMASYCSLRSNPNGTTGAYVLTAGDYIISVQKDSHNIIDKRTWKNAADIWFDNTNPRQSEKNAQSAMDDSGKLSGVPANPDQKAFTAASNLYQDSTDYMHRDSRILTRRDWNNTFPEAPKDTTYSGSGANRVISSRGRKAMTDATKEVFEKDWIYSFNVATDPEFGNVVGSKAYHADNPVSGKDNGLVVADLRGKSYYDKAWQDWLDQIDFSNPKVVQQIVDVSRKANYATTPVDSLGLPMAQHADGANGLKVFKTDHGMNSSATYGLTPLWAATFNADLMTELGEAMGASAIENAISGWYSPAINLHRSPFSGRNFEYYSEDPLLTGKTAAAVIRGVGKKGLFTFVKHFAMNDQETQRNSYLATWATEQTMREIYLKAFEIAFKEPMMTIKYTADSTGRVATKTMRATTGTMATQSCIGQYYGHADYRTLTLLLRGEWGFLGTVQSDMFTMSYAQAFDRTHRAGCDIFLPNGSVPAYTDQSSASAQHMMRRIIHNVGYTIAHSNMMQHNPPGTVFHHAISPWKLFLWLPVALVTGLSVIGAGVWITLRTLQERKNPELFRKKGE